MSQHHLFVSALLGALLWAPGAAFAHCDSLGGPVATAAAEALETGNVNRILPFVPADAEAEWAAAFDRATTVRSQGAESQALADLYFTEMAVRLHRAGEGAPYTGLKPADTEFGPVIPATEKALESGQIKPLLALLRQVIEEGVTQRFSHIAETDSAPKASTTAADVPAARERVSEELAFIGYVEGIYQATKGSAEVEGAMAAGGCGH